MHDDTASALVAFAAFYRLDALFLFVLVCLLLQLRCLSGEIPEQKPISDVCKVQHATFIFTPHPVATLQEAKLQDMVAWR